MEKYQSKRNRAVSILRCFALVLVARALPSAANAYTVNGSVECTDIIREDSNEDYRLANMFWILGYITARNYEDDADAGADVANVKIYALRLDCCRRNQGSDWDDAAIQVYVTLSN
jgi:hypothetical protein